MIGGFIDPAMLIDPLLPTLETAVAGGLEFLDCGACDYDCLGALVCSI